MSTFKAPDPAIATTTAPTALDPPAWFNAAMDEKLEQFNAAIDEKFERFNAAMDEKLERFNAAIDEKLERFMDERLKPITTDLQEMRQHVAMIHMLAANAYNRHRGDGTIPGIHLVPVPFLDGIEPVHAAHPKIHTVLRGVMDIEGLADDELLAYCEGYVEGPVPRDRRGRKGMLAVQIGCWVSGIE